jgi:hypothetical protein
MLRPPRYPCSSPATLQTPSATHQHTAAPARSHRGRSLVVVLRRRHGARSSFVKRLRQAPVPAVSGADAAPVSGWPDAFEGTAQ